MAERRMFTKKITDDDLFASLSSSAQALYLHLSMSADDDGFSNQVSTAMFRSHASVQDLEALLEKRYLIQFENGVIVIRHWRMANALRKDRYTPTVFQEELSKLQIDNNGSYDWLPNGCQSVAVCLPQDRLGKDSIDKNSIGKDIKEKYKKENCEAEAAPESSTPTLEPKPQKHKHGEYKHVLLTDAELDNLKEDYGTQKALDAIKYLDEYIEMKGYKAKNHNLAIRKWVIDAVEKHSARARTNKAAQNANDFRDMLNAWASEGG